MNYLAHVNSWLRLLSLAEIHILTLLVLPGRTLSVGQCPFTLAHFITLLDFLLGSIQGLDRRCLAGRFQKLRVYYGQLVEFITLYSRKLLLKACLFNLIS